MPNGSGFRSISVEAPIMPPSGSPHSLWHSPVPYLFVCLGSMTGLIAFAMLVLAYSHRKFASSHFDSAAGRDYDEENLRDDTALDDGRRLVIMAGDRVATFIAVPISRADANSHDDGEGSPEESAPSILSPNPSNPYFSSATARSHWSSFPSSSIRIGRREFGWGDGGDRRREDDRRVEKEGTRRASDDSGGGILVELNSEVALPVHWEQCLDLLTTGRTANGPPQILAAPLASSFQVTITMTTTSRFKVILTNNYCFFATRLCSTAPLRRTQSSVAILRPTKAVDDSQRQTLLSTDRRREGTEAAAPSNDENHDCDFQAIQKKD
ncbi:uncharacterized protein LOC122019522 [Zingiber officinale]|uniref:uncharacterized protein LOC122019522 n=1 Tax=Zingiber officinale TaxID=94328 RepID=UPI001C4DA311|nr:uncharacterized protein LOC122019522 [Zingiber officinale]